VVRELKDSFGSAFELPLIEEIAQTGVYKEAAEGDILIQIGEYIRFMPLLMEGAIKILREDTEGDELLLYYLERGETCSMTMACCLGNAQSEIRAIAETNAQLMLIPIQKMEEWISKYRTWRNFVFGSYHNRLNELLTTVDNIAFRNMDERLMTYLLRKAAIGQTNTITNTTKRLPMTCIPLGSLFPDCSKNWKNWGRLPWVAIV